MREIKFTRTETNCKCWINIKNKHGEKGKINHIFYDGEMYLKGENISIEVNYCPICGRELAKKIIEVTFPKDEKVAYEKIIKETKQEE